MEDGKGFVVPTRAAGTVPQFVRAEECVPLYMFSYVPSLLLYKYKWRRFARSNLSPRLCPTHASCGMENRCPYVGQTSSMIAVALLAQTYLPRHVTARGESCGELDTSASHAKFSNRTPNTLHTPSCSDSSRSERASSGATHRACGPSTTAAGGPLPASPAPSSNYLHTSFSDATRLTPPQTLRCHCHRRRPRRLRSLRRCCPRRRTHSARHALGRKPGRLLVQSVVWWNRQGHHVARD